MTDVVLIPVHLDFQSRADGANLTATGTVTFRPTARQVEDGHIVVPSGFVVAYRDAPVDIHLAELPDGWAWQATEDINGVKLERLIIPDIAVPNYADLPDIDGDTLDPITPPSAAWKQYIDNLIAELERRDALDTDNAALVEDDDSATALAVAAKKRSLDTTDTGNVASELRVGLEPVLTGINAKTNGCVADGATDDLAALNAIAAKSITLGAPMYLPKADYYISGTLVLNPGCTLTMHPAARILYSGSGTAVQVNSFATQCRHQIRVERPTANWQTTDTTSIGIEVLNTRYAQLDVTVRGFETGLLMHGDNSNGCTYNIVRIGALANSKRNLRFLGTSSGFANQNTFIGGQIRHDSAFSGAGTVDIDLTQTGNNNAFLNVSVEGSTAEHSVHVGATSNNMFLNCRYELNVAAGFLLDAGSNGNYILGGYGNDGPGTAIFSDLGRNFIHGQYGMKSYGQDGGGIAAFDGYAHTSGTDVLFSARGTTGVRLWSVDAGGRAMYWRSGQTSPMIQVDPTTSSALGSYGCVSTGRGSSLDLHMARSASGFPSWITNGSMLKRLDTSLTRTGNGPVTIVTNTADHWVVNLAGNATSIILGKPSENAGYAATIVLEMLQDATGSRTWVAPTNVKWAGGVAPTLTTTPGARDIFTLRFDTTLAVYFEVSRSMGVA